MLLWEEPRGQLILAQRANLSLAAAHQRPHEGDVAAGRRVPVGPTHLGEGVLGAGRGLPSQAGLIHGQIGGLRRTETRRGSQQRQWGQGTR